MSAEVILKFKCSKLLSDKGLETHIKAAVNYWQTKMVKDSKLDIVIIKPRKSK